MTLSRRTLLSSAAATLAATALPLRWAHASVTVGDWQIDTLSDGSLTLPPEFIFGPMPADRIAPILAENGIDASQPLTPPCNVTLLRGAGRTVLIDAGSGTSFQASAGALLDAMDAIGIAPEDVTDVLFTHGHPDHLWGVLDDFDDPMFYEARHAMGGVELDYWMDPATVDSIGAERQAFAVGAARRLDSISDQLDSMADGAEVLPGVTALLTPGHTPGHLSFAVDGPDGGALIVGDAIGNHHVAFGAPDVLSGSDQDMETAAQTRMALLDRAAADGSRVIGFHLPGGGMGRVVRAGDAYRFEVEG